MSPGALVHLGDVFIDAYPLFWVSGGHRLMSTIYFEHIPHMPIHHFLLSVFMWTFCYLESPVIVCYSHQMQVQFRAVLLHKQTKALLFAGLGV